MNPNAVGHPLTATPAINEFTKRKVTGFATRKNARAEYNEYLNFNPSVLTAIFRYGRVYCSSFASRTLLQAKSHNPERSHFSMIFADSFLRSRNAIEKVMVVM
jgi:hypothetical protein